MESANATPPVSVTVLEFEPAVSVPSVIPLPAVVPAVVSATLPAWLVTVVKLTALATVWLSDTSFLPEADAEFTSSCSEIEPFDAVAAATLPLTRPVPAMLPVVAFRLTLPV